MPAFELPPELYSRIEAYCRQCGRQSVEGFVLQALEAAVDRAEEEADALSPEEEEALRTKLRSLGYID
ncbi:MAG: hypothetical protein K9L28_11505 [Synergistales bacterium]|nr:hypothetical protein [Synergistales bacterium]